MDDPRRCKVDVAALTGLTDAQRNVLKKIYGETKNKDGVIYPAQPFGGEGERRRLAHVDCRRQSGDDDAAESAEPALRVRHRDVQVLRVRRSVLGLQPLRVLELQEGHGNWRRPS